MWIGSELRVIARLDIKNEHVIKGIHLEGLRKVGNPLDMAMDYYMQGIDELLFLDSVASLYNRNNIFSVIRAASEKVFVPITIGGGLRKLSDVEEALDSGADKVAINTSAIQNPAFIEEIATKYGSQCVVASIQAKHTQNGWEAYTESGREKTDILVETWCKQLQDLGAGELLITSIDKDGTKLGFDVELMEMVNNSVTIPVLASGGFGKLEHIDALCEKTNLSGLCFASALHYKNIEIKNIKEHIKNKYEQH